MLNALTCDVEEHFHVHNLETVVRRVHWDRHTGHELIYGQTAQAFEAGGGYFHQPSAVVVAERADA